MENQTNKTTPLSEVDELRQQLALFKQRIDQQEIINDRLMRHSMNARISIFTKFNVFTDIIALIISPVIFIALSKIGVPWYFGAFILLLIVIELFHYTARHRQLQRLFTDGNDLLTVRRGLLCFKRKERIWMIIAVPLIILWLAALYWQQGLFSNELTGAGIRGIFMSAIGLFLGLLCCFGFFAWEMHRVNLSIREIDELSENN